MLQVHRFHKKRLIAIGRNTHQNTAKLLCIHKSKTVLSLLNLAAYLINFHIKILFRQICSLCIYCVTFDLEHVA